MDILKKQESSEETLLRNIRTFVVLIGIGLVVGGALSLFYIAYLTSEIIKSPANSEIIQWLLNSFVNEDIFIQG